LAETAFLRARRLRGEGQYSESAAILADLEARYADTSWYSANKALIAVARAEAAHALFEAEAEQLYQQAAALFDKQQFLDAEPLIVRLKQEYAGSTPVADVDRKPSLAEMEQAVADLGRILTVDQGGKGHFTTIQAAIDAAEPNTTVVVQGAGPYVERLRITGKKDGLRIRGEKGVWPVITSSGGSQDIDVLVSVASNGIVLERLILAHGLPRGATMRCVSLERGQLQLRSVLLFMRGSEGLWQGHSTRCAVDDSVMLVSAVSDNAVLNARNCLWLGPEFRAGAATSVDARNCDFAFELVSSDCRLNVMDSIFNVLTFVKNVNAQIDFSNVISATAGNRPLAPAELGRSCLRVDPQFRDPARLDFRLKPRSPCVGRASDGGDIGCRYTPEMTEMVEKAVELRASGIVAF
jgi:hypothetical protein